MGDKSLIGWTDATWNPIRARRADGSKLRTGWHCEKVSPGCKFCYAEAMNVWRGTHEKFVVGAGVEVYLDLDLLLAPLRWRRPRRIFPCSMTDLFGRWVTDEWLDMIFGVMILADWHTYQLTTKRADRMRAYLSEDRGHQVVSSRLAELYVNVPEVARRWPLDKNRAVASARWPVPHVLCGVSVENQPAFDERWPELRETPAAGLWMSYEPALGPVDFTPALAHSIKCEKLPGPGMNGGEPCRCVLLGWGVIGGESGRFARPSHPWWYRDTVARFAAAGKPLFVKQRGAWVPRSWLTREQNDALWQAKSIERYGTLQHSGKFFPETTPWNGRELDDSQDDGECVVYKVGGHGAELTDLPVELRVRQQWERA